MYLTLTTRCNMECCHCCMSATADGVDMTDAVFEAALALINESGPFEWFLTLGGGEPTIHPKFEDWLWRAIRVHSTKLAGCLEEDLARVNVVTNGKRTEIALRLASLARQGFIRASLSQDPWHEGIDERVVRAFTPSKQQSSETDLRHIAGCPLPYNVGRAAETGVGYNSLSDDPCMCPGFMVDTFGGIHPCGCVNSPSITNVFEPDYDVLSDWEEDCRDGDGHYRWRKEQQAS